jgi:hypothetical protein
MNETSETINEKRETKRVKKKPHTHKQTEGGYLPFEFQQWSLTHNNTATPSLFTSSNHTTPFTPFDFAGMEISGFLAAVSSSARSIILRLLKCQKDLEEAR